MLNLVMHSLKGKKGWFILNLAITIIIAIIIPTLFREKYNYFSSFAMIITAVLILVSNFKELSFLHDDRKISYYLSKPISMLDKINIAFISNAIFTTVVFLLTFAISSLAGAIFSANDPSNTLEGFRYLEYVNVALPSVITMYAVLMTIGFIIVLSSTLTGSITASVFATILNYAMPVIILSIIAFVCYTLEKTAVGFSYELMIELSIDKILPIDKIYFIDYFYNKSIDLFYFIRLVLYFGIVYVLTIFVVKTRRNERTGDYIVYHTYKYFISSLVSLLLPMFLIVIMGKFDLSTVVTVIVFLSSLPFYIIISVFDKSFKISKKAFIIYVPLIIIFVATIFLSYRFVKPRMDFIPELSDIKAVYAGAHPIIFSNEGYLKLIEYDSRIILTGNYDEINEIYPNFLATEKDRIERVIKHQKYLMNLKKAPCYFMKYYIIYYLENGKNIIRVYDYLYDLIYY